MKFLLPLLFLSMSISAQNRTLESCGKELKGFIQDSQEYIINNKENSTFDIVFYPGFTYRLELCAQNKNIQLEISLIDEKGNIQFKSNINQGFFRDFKFETIFHGKIIVKPVKTDTQLSEIVIGYKKNKN